MVAGNVDVDEDCTYMDIMPHPLRFDLTWDGDNSGFILSILPSLKLSADDKAVVKWAYLSGWEKLSDGETLVCDMFLNGKLKDPAGVVHDALNRTEGHRTPDGHVWTRWQANGIYRRIHIALGVGRAIAWRRWLGLTLSGYMPPGITWWKMTRWGQVPRQDVVGDSE